MAAQTDPSVDLPIVVGISGASGSILGFRLVRELLLLKQPVELVVTQKAFGVAEQEMNLRLPGGADVRGREIVSALDLPPELGALLTVHGNARLGAPPSSGTHLTRGMVIIPCSMATLGRIAHGISDNLLARAADVTLKERRKLILVPRESPFNSIHLKNMLELSQMGVVILPPMLSFYLEDFSTVEGQIRYTLGKVLDHLNLPHRLHARWGET